MPLLLFLTLVLTQPPASADALAASVPLLIHTPAEGSIEGARMTRHFMQPLGDDRGSSGTHLAFFCNDGVITRASAQYLQQRCRTWLGNAWDGDRHKELRRHR